MLDKKKIDRYMIDECFNELSKIYKKKSKGFEIEIVLVGGASILLNYNFRDVTSDIDAIYIDSNELKDSMKIVSEKHNLNFTWLNDDFKRTVSYTDKLREYSAFYKTYNNSITIRTIKSEYLIAMKLASGRVYKNDISDIVGILCEEKKNGKIITMKKIEKAVFDLYGGWSVIKKDIKNILKEIMKNDNLDKLYVDLKNEENDNRNILLEFDKDYKDVLNESNIDEIINKLNNVK